MSFSILITFKKKEGIVAPPSTLLLISLKINVMETLTHAFIPKAVRNADAKWKRKKGFTIEGMTN